MDDDVAVVSIQRRFRGYHTRIIAQYKSNNAAVTIQRAYREWKYKSTALPADKGYDGDNYAAYAVIDYTGTFTAQDHLIGPFRRRIGAGQMRTERVNHGAFLIDNPLREVAIQKPSEIDAMNTDLGDSFVWLDDTITKLVVFDDYAAIRAAVAKPPGNNWSEVLRVMQKYDDRVLVQVYGLRCFSKGVIPMDPLCGMVSHTARQALDVIETVIRNATKQYALTHIYFALEALQNFLAVRPGRAEFLSTTHITAVGLLRQTAVSNHYKHQLDMLFQYLIYIPTEEIIMPIILEDEPNSIITPTSRACDVVAMVIEVRRTCLSVHGIYLRM
jgi:preprotein translocase subunit Sss1